MTSTTTFKIVSLVPSITELLFDLGLENQVVGRTKFCVHPKDKVSKIPQFGGTKNLHLDRIREICPNLIIANKEENLKSEVEVLQQYFEVMVTDVSTIDENMQMILDIGSRTQTYNCAEEIVQEIKEAFLGIKNVENLGSVLYLIWNQPRMSVGGDTFIHEMLKLAGFTNVCQDYKRYPTITTDMEISPDYVFLSSEPFPFKEKHIDGLRKEFPHAKYVFVDGEMFSWYGSRMRLAPSYFSKLRNCIIKGQFVH